MLPADRARARLQRRPARNNSDVHPAVRRVRNQLPDDDEHEGALGKTATHGRRHPGRSSGYCRMARVSVSVLTFSSRPVEIAWCARFLGRLVLWSHTAFFCVSVSDDHSALPGIGMGDIGALTYINKKEHIMLKLTIPSHIGRPELESHGRLCGDRQRLCASEFRAGTCSRSSRDVTKDERQPVHPGQTTACENQFRRTQSLQYVI